jgi:hypothetical protein
VSLLTEGLRMILTCADYLNASEIHKSKPVVIANWLINSRGRTKSSTTAIIVSNGSLGLSSGTSIAVFVLTN